MTRRTLFRLLFGAVTGLALGLELTAAWDGDDATEPWTAWLIRLPWIPLVALSTGFGAWLVWHLVTEKRKKERRQT